MSRNDPKRRYHDGRDEMNLADFPISALQRQQPTDEAGRKLDKMVYEASRYDPDARRRVTQRVTLTTSSGEGLPTPADEHVILALLCTAKHGNNFSTPLVHFAPGQLFEIMGWDANGRSYERLRGVLRRLKSLTIRYENAWWDAAGRGYEEEVATGIISEYRIARQVSGPRKAGATPRSWVRWTQHFHDSLLKGNIKRLDLDVFFRLRSPTAQRMYRFLDKRFYNSPFLQMDLVEFACGHIGLTESRNVAVLKRRLAPAIKELEAIHFITPADVQDRYQKVRPGVWRVLFHASPTPAVPAPNAEAEVKKRPTAPEKAPAPGVTEGITPEALVVEFYRRWGPALTAQPGPKDLERAQALLREHGAERARALIPCLVELTRKGWPECRSFSGAAQKYLADAVNALERREVREAKKREGQARQQQEKETLAKRQEEERRLQEVWDGLPAAEREAVRQVVLGRLGGLQAPQVFIQRLCLEEIGRRYPAHSPDPGSAVTGQAGPDSGAEK